MSARGLSEEELEEMSARFKKNIIAQRKFLYKNEYTGN